MDASFEDRYTQWHQRAGYVVTLLIKKLSYLEP